MLELNQRWKEISYIILPYCLSPSQWLTIFSGHTLWKFKAKLFSGIIVMLIILSLFYRAFLGFGQAKFPDDSLVLGSTNFQCCPSYLKIMMFDSEVGNIDSKIIISFHYSKFVKHSVSHLFFSHRQKLFISVKFYLLWKISKSGNFLGCPFRLFAHVCQVKPFFHLLLLGWNSPKSLHKKSWFVMRNSQNVTSFL